MNNCPELHKVEKQLQAEITEGKYGPSNRLPSKHQLVERFNVSRPTIAHVPRSLPVTPRAEITRRAART
jgi:DNA-binding GntR family transcriptional regulator